MKKTLYYTEDHVRELLVTHEFQVTMRKDGSARADVSLPFLDRLTILDRFMLSRCSDTPDDAVARFKARTLKRIETLERERNRLVDSVNMANREVPIKLYARYRPITSPEEP